MLNLKATVIFMTVLLALINQFRDEITLKAARFDQLRIEMRFDQWLLLHAE